MVRFPKIALVASLVALLHYAITAQEFQPTSVTGLQNVVRLTDDVYSGSEPVGEAAFASLMQLGVRTIVSVDGASPQLELAAKYGIRYIHIPFGYDSIPLPAQLSLTRAAREAKTPLYVHCHHGKHRGPAAAAIVCRARGLVDASGALQIMEEAGTSQDYKGLWKDVRNYVIPAVDAELPPLAEVAEVESLAAAMARMDRNFDRLKLLASAAWQVPADHPDLTATQESLLLLENLHEAVRRISEADRSTQYNAEFTSMLTESETLARELHSALNADDATVATEAFKLLQKSCVQCHEKYRDLK